MAEVAPLAPKQPAALAADDADDSIDSHIVDDIKEADGGAAKPKRTRARKPADEAE